MLDWLRFPNTIYATQKSLKDVKNLVFVFQIVTALVSIGYFIYALVTGAGLLWANALSLSLLAVFNVVRFTTREVPENKANKKALKKIYRWVNILIRAFTLAVMLYGVYAATASDTDNQQMFALTVIYASIMVMLWIIQLIIEIVLDIFDSKVDYISKEFQKDMEPIMQDHIEPVVSKVNTVIETKDKIVSKAEEIGVKTYEAVESIKKPILGFAESVRKKLGSCSLQEPEEMPTAELPSSEASQTDINAQI